MTTDESENIYKINKYKNFLRLDIRCSRPFNLSARNPTKAARELAENVNFQLAREAFFSLVLASRSLGYSS